VSRSDPIELISPADRALFLSPHFDDVALSCGGTAAEAAAGGQVVVATIFAGQPPGELNAFARWQHDRWGTHDGAVDRRRDEDAAAMRALGASAIWLDFPDAIYRDSWYLNDETLFGPINPGDAATSSSIRESITRLLATHQPEVVYAPLGVGGHVDHRMTRDAAIAGHRVGVELLLYEDFPYCVTSDAVDRWRSELPLRLVPCLVDVTASLDARIRAIEAYPSQLPTIFRHYGPWESLVRAYATALSQRPDHYAERFWRVVSDSI
jgi:LmbE family N-acetylglucosaminyl deacetylase